MDTVVFRKEYLETVKSVAAAENKGTTEAFVQVCCAYFVESEQFDDYELSYYMGRIGNRKFRVDAYCEDDYDQSMSVVIADFSGDEEQEKLNLTDLNNLMKQVNVFLKESFSGKLKEEVEISTKAYDLVDRLHSLKKELRKIKIFLITDKELGSTTSKASTEGESEGILCEYHFWDMPRFQRLLDNASRYEPIEIDLEKMNGSGLPCLAASNVDIQYCQCFLSVLSGEFLADIYDSYGSRLMEGNVRTFLSARGNVNKAIRRTILANDRNMFFTYNNGVAATASQIETQTINGQLYITKLTNLQIVNGGQTTASLSDTRRKYKASLDGIFVQMKLTVVDDTDQAGEIIPNISRYSNSQNKVSEADFFSNHEFNIRMQQISRQLYAPAALGLQYETHWFYERARGQYENEQSKLTAAEKKKFLLVNPKSQKFDKTTMAKIENAWRCQPHIASAGAQKSFKHWAEVIVTEWKKEPDSFNELYYKNLISLLLMFTFLEKEITKQSWYENGYRANIIVYTISYFNYQAEKQFPDRVLDRTDIWNKQGLSDSLKLELLKIAHLIFETITDPSRPVMNVTEWCKKELCWTQCKKKKYTLSQEVLENFTYRDIVADEKKDSKKTQKIDSGISFQIKVVEKGSTFWKSLSLFAVQNHLLNEKEMSLLSVAVGIDSGKLPTEKQSKVILEILEKAKDEGFTS